VLDVARLEAEIGQRLAALPALQTDAVRAVRRAFSRRLTATPPRQVVALALRLLSRPEMAPRFLAYELICHHRAALQSLRAADLARLGRGLDSWGAVDCFACYLAGRAWRERQVTDRLVHGWARSPDRWWRRAALVSTVPLNSKAHGGSGDGPRTLAVCRLLVNDRDDMVVKALSWALRALTQRDPESVRRFLIEQQDGLAARVLREVRNKLATGRKNPRRK
jgi:3-methyladenine DNA glycosylase AlkD